MESLEIREENGGKYVFAVVKQAGRPTVDVLSEALPGLVAGIKFDKSMRWNASNVAFSRPLRWFVALLGETVVPFEYAGLRSGNVSRGLRRYNSPEIVVPSADQYFYVIKKNGIVIDAEERKRLVVEGVKKIAASVKVEAIVPPELLNEVANLFEKPLPFLSGFEEEFLALPEDVLISLRW